jgi:predicted ATPase
LAAPHVRDTTPLFAALLSIPFGDRYPKLRPKPAQQRRRTFAALLDQFESLSHQKPILLLFEDAQWADATSLELLNLTVNRVRQLPVLALFTLRPEFESPWVGLPNVGMLKLGRLDRSNVERIVMQVAGGRALPTEVMNQIVAKTDGNPCSSKNSQRQYSKGISWSRTRTAIGLMGLCLHSPFLRPSKTL